MWASENGYGGLWDGDNLKYDISSEEYQSASRAFNKAQEEHYYKNPRPYKVYESLQEYISVIDPGSLTIGESLTLVTIPKNLPWTHEEHWNSWLEQFRANEKAVQSIIDNAKISIKSVSIEDLLAKYSGVL